MLWLAEDTLGSAGQPALPTVLCLVLCSLHVLALVLRGLLQASAVQSVTSVVRLP